MKIWFVEVGEPLLFEKNERMHRYGMLMPYLVAAGHDVTWWCSSFSHFKKSQLRDQDSTEMVDGVRLKILHTPGYSKNISLARFKHNYSFAAKFKKLAAQEPKPDLIVAPVPILEASYEAIRYGKRNNVPVVTDIRDEWPEEFVHVLPQSLKLVGKIVLLPYYLLMKAIAKNASAIMAISKRQLKYGLKYADRPQGPWDQIFYIGYKKKIFDQQMIQDSVIWWKDLGVRPESFLICFFGSISDVFLNLETTINAVNELSKTMDIQLVICGHGKKQEALKKMVRDPKVIFFPGWIDALKINSLMKISKVGLAPYAKGTAMTMPNKVFEYLSEGLPILSSIAGEMSEYIDQYKCGLSYDADSVSDFQKKLVILFNNRETLKQMGINAAELFQTGFSADAIDRQMLQFLESIAKSRA